MLAYALLAAYVVGSTVAAVVNPALSDLLQPKTQSDRIAALAVEVALVTLMLVAIQIWIVLRQTQLQKTELDIIKRQDELMNRIEDLEIEAAMTVSPWPGEAYAIDVHLTVTNRGKGVHGYYLYLFLQEFESSSSLALDSKFAREWSQGDSTYTFVPGGGSYSLTEYRKWFDLLLPGDGQRTQLPNVSIWIPEAGAYVLCCRIQTLNGVFPRNKPYATMELRSF